MAHVRWTLPLLLALALVCAGAQPAWAHPLLLRATPSPESVLPSIPSRVELVFSEDLSGPPSRITVVDHDHHAVTVGNTVVSRGNPRVIEVRLSHLRPGSYLVSWTVVSAEDGHVVHGSYIFSVKVRSPGALLSGSSPGGQGIPDADTLAALVAHWLLLLAAVTWFGSGAFSVLVLSPLRREGGAWDQVEAARLVALIRLSAVILLGANAIALTVDAHQLAGETWQAALSASTLSDLLAGQHGQLWIAQQVLAILALAATAVIPTQRPVPRWLTPAVAEGASWHVASWAQVPLGILYLYALAASGHAASANVGLLFSGHLVSAAVVVDLLHLLAVGLWLGGQIYIVLVLIPALTPAAVGAGGSRTFLAALDRFSPVAYVSVALFTVTGPFNATIHISSWTAFFGSTYGRALSVKLVLIAIMLLISAFTVYTLRPRIRRALDEPGSSEEIARSLMGGLLSWLRINPLLGAGVLLATSVMFFYPVPESFSQSVPSGPAWRAAGLSGITVHFLVFGHRHSALGYAATEQGVYRLRGADWQRVLNVSSVWSVSLSNDDRTVLAGDEAGDVYLSRDGGATWRRTSVTTQGIYAVSIKPDNPQWLLAGAGEGLYLSRDGGVHWERRLMLPQSAGSAFAWQPGNPRVLFAGVVAGGAGGSTSAYISRDAGVTWQLFGQGLQSGGGIMSLLATRQSRVFAGTMGHAIWNASLAQPTWQRVASGMPVTNDHVAGIAGISGRPGTLVVGTLGQGVFRSLGGARHWANISSGLPKSANATIVLSVAYSPERQVLYAGTVDGVYELSTGGS